MMVATTGSSRPLVAYSVDEKLAARVSRCGSYTCGLKVRAFIITVSVIGAYMLMIGCAITGYEFSVGNQDAAVIALFFTLSLMILYVLLMYACALKERHRLKQLPTAQEYSFL